MVLVLAGCAGAPPGRPAPVLTAAAAAQALAPIRYPMIAGGEFASDAQVGQVMVLDVWASWCEPCRESFPHLDRLAAERPDVVVVGLSMDADDEKFRAFLDEFRPRFTIARDAGETAIGPPLHIRRLPTLILVDRAGRVRMRLEEPRPADYEALPRLVDALRGER